MTDLQVERRPERIREKKTFWEAYGANIATIAGIIVMAALVYAFLAHNDFQFTFGSADQTPAAQVGSQPIPTDQSLVDQTPARTIGPAMYGTLTDEQRKKLEDDEVRRTGAKPVH